MSNLSKAEWLPICKWGGCSRCVAAIKMSFRYQPPGAHRTGKSAPGRNFQPYVVAPLVKDKRQKLKVLKSKEWGFPKLSSGQLQFFQKIVICEAMSKRAGSPVRGLLISQLAARWQCEQSLDASDLPSVNYTSPRRSPRPPVSCGQDAMWSAARRGGWSGYGARRMWGFISTSSNATPSLPSTIEMSSCANYVGLLNSDIDKFGKNNLCLQG